MPTDPLFVGSAVAGLLGLLALAMQLWRFSGSPEANHGSWDPPAITESRRYVPPSYRLVLDQASSGWTDADSWHRIVSGLVDIAARIGAPHPVAPQRPDRAWFEAELARLDEHFNHPTPTPHDLRPAGDHP